MWSSRDISLIITFTVLSTINFAAVLQTFTLLTGIPGIYYGVDLIGATLSTVGFLLFEGRRWRRTVLGLLIFLISLSLNFGGSSVTIITRVPIVLKMFITDIIFNSFYGYFEKRNKLIWLSVSQSVTFFMISPFFDILFFSFFVPFETLTPLLNLVILMLPLILGVSLAGGYLGYKIYRRLEKLPQKIFK
jgi:hypothetical protein